jgi:hypothetical protein
MPYSHSAPRSGSKKEEQKVLQETTAKKFEKNRKKKNLQKSTAKNLEKKTPAEMDAENFENIEPKKKLT